MSKDRSLNVMALLLSFLVCSSLARAQSAQNAIPRRLTLAEAESLLLDRNLSVLASKYQIEVNRAARLIAGYKPNPVVTVGLEQVPFYSPLPGSFPRFATTNPDAGANPVWTIRVDKIWERGGKRELRARLADEQIQLSEAQMVDAVRAQLFELRRAFAAATLARRTLELVESAEQQYAQTETLTQAKLDQGDIPKVELYRVAAGRLQYQQAVLQARSSYDTATRDVLNVLGAREQDIAVSVASSGPLQLPGGSRSPLLDIVHEFDDRPLALTLEDLRTTALANRPDVIAARRLVESAVTSVDLARAQHTRDVDTAYEYQRTGSDHTAGVVVQVPVFLYNNQKVLVTQTEAQKRASETQLKQAELQAVTDVGKAYQAYLSARRVLDLYSGENLQQIEKLRSVAALSYREGASSLLELLDAQRGYNSAMSGYYQARSDYQMSLWQIEQAIGGPAR